MAAASGRTRTARIRLDRLLLERGHARSRERAQALVMAGVVRVGGRPAGKPGSLVPSDAVVTVTGADHPYVGRGGVKLQGALEAFGIDPRGRVALDVGASTGGFTDCLLQRGALRVYALDVGAGLIDWSLRTDARVVLMERRNARHLRPGDLLEVIDLAVIDVSFISLRLILPAVAPLLAPQGDIVALVKPQFEVGRREVGAGGIVGEPRLHLEALRAVARAATASGLGILAACRSPITGAQGNREFFLRLTPGGVGLRESDQERLFGGILDA
jgi:23S rRNA (cytidine1920-2'-O)/16S rRNA (cytidine1409-2'-O)-methyltransferase